MRVVIDIECNGLVDPDKVWVIVCKDIDTGNVKIFREVTDDAFEKKRFLRFAKGVTLWIGHNVLGYDLPVLSRIVHDEYFANLDASRVADTLILSKLANYSRSGHSIESYGIEFGIAKGNNSSPDFFKQWSQELEDYCVRDVEITHKVYERLKSLLDPGGAGVAGAHLEERFQYVVNSLHDNGFAFNAPAARLLHEDVSKELAFLDEQILQAFPPKEVLIREFTPKATKFGTISKTSVPRQLHENIHQYEVGRTYRHTKLEPFNPSSHKQLIEILNEANWKPEDKTKTHIETERELGVLRRSKSRHSLGGNSLSGLNSKLEVLKVTGWSINENNLDTLPPEAPQPARLLARRILLESRRRTLTEWLSLVRDDGRIHGRFQGIGAWTHRMSHQQPNTANIPREFKEDGSVKFLGREMRSLWCAPHDRLLVGVDAEGIQLRIFAHYIDDKEFTDALVHGRKSDKTDPHSLNQRILGDVCKTRQAAKRFVYALLLGGGMGKLAQILGCSVSEARKALDRLLERYQGFAYLKEKVIPKDARKGFFTGLDGRRVPIPGATDSERAHLCMSGYLQNGEKILIARAACIIDDALHEEKARGDWFFVNIVHDELISEVKNDMDFALRIAEIKANAIAEAGRYYNLKCPTAGSYYDDDHQRYTIGPNWYITH